MKSPTFARGWHGLVVILVSLLSGCYVSPTPREPVTIPGTPPAFSCKRILNARWGEFRFGVDSPDEVASIIANSWGVDKEQITSVKYQSGDFHLGWKDESQGILHIAKFREETLRSIEVRFLLTPTLAQALNCLGSPESYAAYLEQQHELTGFVLMLWYLERGFVLMHDSLSQRKSPPADLSALRIEFLYVVPPGTSEQMIPNVFLLGYLPVAQDWWQCVLRPWPGSLGVTEVESFLGDDPRCK